MQFIGREKQLRTLNNIISNIINFNLVVIHGPPSSGKSLILNHVLKHQNINHVYVSCRCIATVKQFFDVLLNGIHDKFQANRSIKTKDNKENINKSNNNHETLKHTQYIGWRNYSIQKQCNSAATFARILQNEDLSGKKSFYIVLDDFERLYNIDNRLISSLIQITDSEPLLKATESKIGFILIGGSSSMINIKDIVGSKHSIVVPIAFAQYTNKDLKSILLDTTQHIFTGTKLNENERKSIIKLLVDSFNIETRRIDRFHQYLALLMPHFIQISTKISRKKLSRMEYKEEGKDVEDMDIDDDDNNKNKNKLIHEIKILILSLYETASKSQDLTMDYASNQALNLKYKEERAEPDLPYVSKLLLLSSYLASFNSHKWNEYQFADIQRKRTKRKKRAPMSTKNEHTLRQKGPQTFTFRDLSGIFIELFKREAPVEFNKDLKHIHDIHSQIAHLISLSFISVVSRQGTLDDIKFKCNIDHDFAKFIADKIGITKWQNNLEAFAVGR